MTRAVIITSYLEYPLDLPALLQPEDRIVCLDGGYDIAQRQGLRPDLLLGDFDSISGPSGQLISGADREAGFEIRRYPPEKDYTDLELAFRILDPEETPDLLVVGGLGGRLDQTLINIQLLQQYTASPAQWPEEIFPKGRPDPACEAEYGSFRRYRHIELIDGHNRCFAVHGDEREDARGIAIPRMPGCYLSLLPLSEECSGVDLDGVKYPVSSAVLHRGASLSISNEFCAPEAHLRVRRGSLLVVITRGNENDF